MPDLTRTFISGQPGDRWANDTGKVRYQFICQLSNSCGVCIQYHMLIGVWWPIPIHRRCNCQQVPIMPGAEARPFANFQEIWDNLSPSQQQSAVGKSAYRLIRDGVVDFKDVVSPTHVLTLKEVVAEQKLTVAQMTRAGVKPHIADAAFGAANTPAAVLNQQRQQALIDKIRGAGLSDQQIKDLVGKAITERVGIKAGPSGAMKMPGPHGGLSAELIRLLHRYDLAKPVAAKPTGLDRFREAFAGEDQHEYEARLTGAIREAQGDAVAEAAAKIRTEWRINLFGPLSRAVERRIADLTGVEYAEGLVPELPLTHVLSAAETKAVDAIISQSQADLAARNIESLQVYRGIRYDPKEGRALTSWTMDKATAEQYTFGTGRVISEVIPANRVGMIFAPAEDAEIAVLTRPVKP